MNLTHQAGPVYVNPNAPQVAQEVEPTSVVKDSGNFVTQTVYGFLDFTTTIGNTIMVFSPQSAAAPGLYILIFGFKFFLIKILIKTQSHQKPHHNQSSALLLKQNHQ